MSIPETDTSAPMPRSPGAPDPLWLIHAVIRAASPGLAVDAVDLRRHVTPIALLSVGKASLAMARAAAAQIGDRVSHSFATTLPEHADDVFWNSLPGQVFACDHPFPTERNVRASRQLVKWVGSLPVQSHVLVMLSGGTSAHLCLPAEGVTLQDIVASTRVLQRSGADIHELNCVRRHCELLKGGRLALLLQPRSVTSYVLSDVIGDPLHDIGSGPTAPDPTTFKHAAAVCARYGLAQVAPSVTSFIARGESGRLPENPGTSAAFPIPPSGHVIASNNSVLAAIRSALPDHNYLVAEVQGDLQRSASEVADCLARATVRTAATSSRPFAVLAGGEWTVDVLNTQGLGGPSQELALRLAATLSIRRPWAALTLSTDGRDGPTDHAGAIVSNYTRDLALERGIDLHEAIASHDSTTALGKLESLVTTGSTGTNLNHIAAVLVQ